MKITWAPTLWLITITAVQGSWLFSIWHIFSLKWNEPALPFCGFYGFYALSFGLTKWFQSRNIHSIYRYGFGWLLWLSMTIILIKLERYGRMEWRDPIWCANLLEGLARMIPLITPEKIIFFFSAVFWFLGQRLAKVRMEFNVSLSEFQFGFMILLIVFFIYSRIQIDVTALTPVPLIFFISALISMSLAYAGTGKGWMTGRFRRQWLGILLLSLLIIMILGFFFIILANPDVIRWIYAVLKKTGVAIWEFIIAIIVFIAGLFPDPEPFELPGRDVPAFGMQGGRSTLFRIPENVRRIGGYVYMGFWLILILLALRTIAAQVFNWLHRAISGTQEVEVETLPGAFRKDLLNMLKKIGVWLAQLSGQFTKRFRQIFAMDSTDKNLHNVRQIYRQLLKSAYKSGLPRGEFQTPFEYQIELVKWLPQAKRDIEFITSQYVACRYSRYIPCEQTSEQITRSWLDIKYRHLKISKKLRGKSLWSRWRRI